MVGEKPRHWAVLGGGMLGMTLALRLAQSGQRVTLIEAAPGLGGLTSAWQLGDVVWDRYYHVTLLSDAHLRSLLRELDLEASIAWHTTRTNFYAADGLAPLNDVVDYLKLPHLRLLDKLRLAGTIVMASRRGDGAALEHYPVDDWLVRRSGRRVFDLIWKPLLRAKLGENYRFASAAFIWSVIRRFYAARRGGMRTEMFGYVPGGYARVVERLRERLHDLGVEVRTGSPVRSVAVDGSGHRVQFAEESMRCDRVVVSFAAPLAAAVCGQLSDTEKARLRALRYQGVICASLLLTRPLGGAYLTYITDETLPFTTVIEMSTLVGREALCNHHLVYLPKYVPADSPWFDYPDEEVRARFVAGLKRMFSDLDETQISAFQVARTRHVLALPTLNYSAGLPPHETSVDGLYVVNSAQIVNASLNVNDTVKLANDAAAWLLSRQG